MSAQTKAAHRRYLTAQVKRERKAVNNVNLSPSQHEAALGRLTKAEAALARMKGAEPATKKKGKRKGRKRSRR